MTTSTKIFAILAITINAVIGLVNAEKYLKQKPDFLTPCQLQDANFNKCLGGNFQVLFREWKDGVPGLKSVGSLDPLQISRIVIAQDPKNPVALNAELTNIVITGFSGAIVQEFSFDSKTLTLQTKLTIPKLHFDSDYKLKGRILNLDLNGNGKTFFEVEKCTAFLSIQVKLRDEYGFTFTDVDKLHADLVDIGGFHIEFHNLFNGQKDLEETTNAVFNQNWHDFYKVLKPAIQEAVQVVMEDRIPKIFSYVPANYVIADVSTLSQHGR